MNVHCESRASTGQCPNDAQWWITGPGIISHAACESCKEFWLTQGATANPLKGGVLEQTKIRQGEKR